MDRFKGMFTVAGVMFGSLRIVLQGLWLLLLYAAFSTLVLFSLSAFQLQNEIRSFKTTDGKSLAIWRVLHEQTEWKAAKRDLDTISANIAELLQKNATRREDLTLNQKKIIDEEQQCQRLISDFEVKFVPPHVAIGIPGVADVDKCNDSYFNIYLLTVEADEKTRSDLLALRLDIKNQINKYKDASNFSSYLKTAIEAASERIKELRANKAEVIAEIKKIANIDGSSQIGIGDFLNSLSYLEERENGEENFGILPNFSQMPSDMLTLILVMSMGALGGTMHLTRTYFVNRFSTQGNVLEATTSYYLFRPLLGAITALSVFILAKAGVLVITIQSPSSDGASLSPFFISFLGIISGLLAEQALDTIQGVGSRWFTASGHADRPRWAYHLSEHLRLTTRNPAAMTDGDKAAVAKLVAALGVQEDVVDDWLNERERVSPDYQKLISAYLQMPAREIFSDLPM